MYMIISYLKAKLTFFSKIFLAENYKYLHRLLFIYRLYLYYYHTACPKKSCSSLYSTIYVLYKFGQDFLNIWYFLVYLGTAAAVFLHILKLL